ncbi:hypothetical protein DGG96_17160 [Legionella qingyii]|uniref:Uncharacterized protein n=1 Tax=Legionella qingyii TaxID=2184757 RepID=A0A317TXT9_9GAMM|nr:hypothetical protein DGG96_17160 [Legionella qingyii]
MKLYCQLSYEISRGWPFIADINFLFLIIVMNPLTLTQRSTAFEATDKMLWVWQVLSKILLKIDETIFVYSKILPRRCFSKLKRRSI